MMVHHRHPIAFHGVEAISASTTPTILRREDSDFVQGIFGQVRQSGLSGLHASRVVTEPGETMHLFLPVHRVYNVLMCQAFCDITGQPRVDDAHIVEAGMVVRRLTDNGEEEAWMHNEHGARGWMALARSQRAIDPDASKRRVPTSGHPVLDQQMGLSAPLPGWSEATSPMFVMPQDICQSTGKTVVYGLIDVFSSEASSSKPQVTFNDEDVQASIPSMLRASSSSKQPSIPFAGQEIGSTQRTAIEARPESDGLKKKYRAYVTALNQLLVQLDLEGDATASVSLRKRLDGLRVPLDGQVSISALQHIREAIAFFIERSRNTLRMPTAWATIDQANADAFARLVRTLLTGRLNGFVPNMPRYGQRGATYVAYAFLRVDDEPGCPPRLLWSPRSAPFTIAPWFETGPAPPPLVQLPPISREGVKAMKPNVVFQVPKTLFNFLHQNDPKKFLDGDVSPGNNSGGDWLCGLNIAIITICAFILLWVVVFAMNFVFWWLPFIYICIPIPAFLKKLFGSS